MILRTTLSGDIINPQKMKHSASQRTEKSVEGWETRNAASRFRSSELAQRMKVPGAKLGILRSLARFQQVERES